MTPLPSVSCIDMEAFKETLFVSVYCSKAHGYKSIPDTSRPGLPGKRKQQATSSTRADVYACSQPLWTMPSTLRLTSTDGSTDRSLVSRGTGTFCRCRYVETCHLPIPPPRISPPHMYLSLHGPRTTDHGPRRKKTASPICGPILLRRRKPERERRPLPSRLFPCLRDARIPLVVPPSTSSMLASIAACSCLRAVLAQSVPYAETATPSSGPDGAGGRCAPLSGSLPHGKTKAAPTHARLRD